MGEDDRSAQSARDDQRIALEIVGLDHHTDPFVAAVHATRMPMIITNPRLADNPIVFANDAFCRLTGYARDAIIGRNCRFLQGPETDPATVLKIHDAVARAEPIEIDVRNHREDGASFWNRLLMAPVYDCDNKLAYFFASQVDVTSERERLDALEDDNASLMAELTERLQAQHQREREFDTVLAAGQLGAWSLDLKHQVLTPSDQCKALFGLRPNDEFTYATRLASIEPDDRHRAQAALERTIAEGTPYDVEYRIRWPDGSTRWLVSRAQPFFGADGNPLRLAGVSLDITDVKLAERKKLALAELTDRFRDLDDAADISYVAAELIGRTLDVSRAGYGLVDRAAETITIERDWNAPGVNTLAGVLAFRDYGSYIEDLKRGETAIVEDARSDPRTSATASALAGISATAFINMPLTDQGDLVALLYINHASPRVWSVEDIEFLREVAERTLVATERRRAERELAELAASLERQVADRTAELMLAEDALRQSQKMEAVGQLTGGVAHDFNNLLTVIRGSIDLLRRPDVSDERRTRYIDAIADTAERATKLTSQLLAFARRQALKPEVFDVCAGVTEIKQMILTLLGSRITVAMDCANQPCLVNADRSQFDAALVNLAVNARDAMAGEGELTIGVGRASGKPSGGAGPASQGDFVTITVSDTGTGIAEDQLDKIFEPFFTTKGVGEGTGLGLSQVFGFTRQSGGDVVVRSEAGHGATFIMYLPSCNAAPTRVAPEPGDHGPAIGRGACVMVVEDNPDVGAFAAQALAELGYNAVLAKDGQTALDKLSADGASFDVVFSDVMMPGMTGLQLGHEIRRRFPGLPVILTSGYSSVLAAGGTQGFDLVHKPYSVDELSRALQKLAASRPSS